MKISKLSKKFKSCMSTSSVQTIPSIQYQQGEGKGKDVTSLSDFGSDSVAMGGRYSSGRGRLSDNINELTALITDERIDGAIQQTLYPRPSRANNYYDNTHSENETLSLADSLMDRCDEDLEWHRQQRKNGGGGGGGDKRTSLIEQQRNESLRPTSTATLVSGPNPQAKEVVVNATEGGVPMYERVGTLETSSSETSSEGRVEPPSSPPQPPQDVKMMSEPGEHISPMNWGYPGYLSSSEYDVYLQFRSEISKRPTIFRDTIFCFGYVEEEPYALCRWLRARKFDYEKVITMVEQAIECSSEASKHKFYANASEALGVDPTIYFSLYPELFCGYSKQGCPLYITRAGECDIRKIMSVTTEAKIINFHWYCMKIAFGGRLASIKRSDPNVHRFEGFVIFDMAGLSIQGCMDAMNVFKAQTNIDQLCFPESLNRFIVINAPSAFSIIWRIVKTLVDARTAAKVEIYASKKHIWQKRLLELINEHELPSDYGGKAPSTQEVYRNQTTEEGLARQFTIPITTKDSSSEHHDIYLQGGESLELIVFTKSTKPGTLVVSKVLEDKKNNFEIGRLKVKHSGEGLSLEEEEPTRISFPHEVKGPGKFKIALSCTTGKEVFVLVGKVRSNESNTIQGEISLPKSSISNTGHKEEENLQSDDMVWVHKSRSQDVTTQKNESFRNLTPPCLPLTDDIPSNDPEEVDEDWDSSFVPSKSKTSFLSMPVITMPPARAIYITFGVVMFIMIHDFWLIWCLVQEGALCDDNISSTM